MRTNAEILEYYVRAAESARTPEFYERVRLPRPVAGEARVEYRKPYLTREVVEKWRIGAAPTLAQCRTFTLTEDELRRVGLLVTSERDGHGEYMFFRDAMVIPFVEDAPGNGSEIVYLAARRLRDYDTDGQPLPKERKVLYPRTPNAAGVGGLARPLGFRVSAALRDLDARGLLLVEGCLDAIALVEGGWNALALLGNQVREELAQRLCQARAAGAAARRPAPEVSA